MPTKHKKSRKTKKPQSEPEPFDLSKYVVPAPEETAKERSLGELIDYVWANRKQPVLVFSIEEMEVLRGDKFKSKFYRTCLWAARGFRGLDLKIEVAHEVWDEPGPLPVVIETSSSADRYIRLARKYHGTGKVRAKKPKAAKVKKPVKPKAKKPVKAKKTKAVKSRRKPRRPIVDNC